MLIRLRPQSIGRSRDAGCRQPPLFEAKLFKHKAKISPSRTRRAGQDCRCGEQGQMASRQRRAKEKKRNPPRFHDFQMQQALTTGCAIRSAPCPAQKLMRRELGDEARSR